ncbi:MAG: portal protein [Kiritimatiellia bacterium]
MSDDAEYEGPEPGTQKGELSALAGERGTPEAGELPSRYGKIVNYAEDDDLAKQVLAHVQTQVMRFDVQPQRQKFVRVGGTMDIADRMWRVALNRDETNSQTKDTLSNVTSPMYHIQVRSITAGESSIFFSDGHMPAEYEPEINTTEYAREDGVLMAEQQNMLEQYTFDEDKRVPKLKDVLHFANKYGQQVVGMDWCRRTREVTERVPDKKKGKLSNGRWASYKMETKRRVVKDCPEFVRIPVEDCWFDSQIKDIADQRVFAYRQRIGVEDLYAMQSDGYLKNVECLTQAEMYMGEYIQNSVIQQRMLNAGENTTMQKTGEVEVWNVWCRIPVETKAKRGKPKARWADGEVMPEIWWFVYAGNLLAGAGKCLKAVRNPHRHGQIPFKLIHSHKDDKGAYSVGYAELIQSLYWQAVTNLNQAVDNVTERNWAPMTANGPIHTKDLTFKRNKLIKLDRSTEFKRLEIQDTTQITMEMHAIVERMANQLTGADKPMQAQALGQRTSATEAQNVFDLAMLPLDEKAAFMADQIFPWMLEMDSELWRQYGDPEAVISLTHNNQIVEVNPAELYGPIRTKVTAVTRFRNNTMRKQQLNSFLQNVAPIFVNVMGEKGLAILGREVFDIFGLSKAEEIFPITGDYDAHARAISEVEDILVAGIWVEPKAEENQVAHLAVLEPALRQFELLGDTPPANIERMRLHIAMRHQFQAQKTQRVNSAMQLMQGGGNPQEAPQGTVGEMGANQAEADMGAQANG